MNEQKIVNAIMRPIAKADNSQLATLITKVMTEFLCVGEGYSINDPEVEKMYESYQGDGHAFWVIEAGDRILGGGGIGPLVGGDSTVCELKKMYFYPELRGQGWGKRMIQQCLSAAREFGYETCYIETVERMTTAIGLYQKSGFSRISCQMGRTGHSSCETYFKMEL